MAMQSNRRRVEARIKREILASADIVCTTLSGAGSTSLKQDLQLAGRLELCFAVFLVSSLAFCTDVTYSLFVGVSAHLLVLL